MTPDEKHVRYRDGFEPGHLYELIYRAKEPTVGASDLPPLATSAPSFAILKRTIWEPPIRSTDPTIWPIIEGSPQSGG